ncbi:recombinase family protein [Parvibaculum indicum]|uniref:recombinase family protein n=1 Tax=Parvibaculum indicum TaxID=562969 RepID=UPI001FEB3816|nr:recombinase family protein [Parvibaculum indicum]
MQQESSIEDQVSLCRAHARRDGHDVVAVYSDRARSGGSMFGRDGLMDMMEAAKAGRFDVLVVESLDRLSRDMEDLAGLYKRLGFMGIDISAVHEGVANTVTIGLRGLVGQLYREDNAKKIRRGMSGVVRGGRHAGGRAYGYRAVAGAPGELEIDEAEAAIVRRIFAEYAAGRVPREIAGDLNREGIAPPRGRQWNASTINGNARRGSGIVFNELYVGRIVWNKVRMVRHPDTGRKISRPNPKDQWESAAAPHLRIVDDETWAKVHELKSGRGGEHVKRGRRGSYLLSGLLKCGCCGSGLSIHDYDKTGKARVRCSAVRESGACSNRRILYLRDVEAAVLDGMRAQLRDPRLIEIYVRKYNEERRRLASGRAQRRMKMEVRLGEIAREIDRLVTAIAKGEMPGAVAGPMTAKLDAEKQELEEQLGGMEAAPKVVSIHPATIDQYLATVDRLAETLTDHATAKEDRGPLIADMRSLIHTVTVHPDGPKGPFDVEVKGKLAALMEAPVFPQARHSGFAVVAEEGLEPPTRGL